MNNSRLGPRNCPLARFLLVQVSALQWEKQGRARLWTSKSGNLTIVREAGAFRGLGRWVLGGCALKHPYHYVGDVRPRCTRDEEDEANCLPATYSRIPSVNRTQALLSY